MTPTRFNPGDLNQFSLLRNLPPPVFGYISGQLELEHYNAGDEVASSEDSTPQVCFLLQGEIELAAPEGVKQIIPTEPDKEAEPLQYKSETDIIRAVDQVSILRCPQELYDNIRKLAPHLQQQTNQSAKHLKSQIRETDIFWRFYDSFKEGKLKLPSQPGIAMRISKVVNDPRTDSLDIARVIQADPTVAGRIISVVNNAAYRGKSPIDNLPNAVSRLGRKVTQNLVTSFALSRLFDASSPPLKKFMTSAWQHASYVAAICHELGRVASGLSSDNALLCGLVHDIGILPIINVAHTQPELMQNPQQLNLIVNRLKGEIGAVVLREWGFPNGFIQAALHSEDWMQDINDKPDYVDLVIVAQLHSFIGTKRMQQLPRLDLVPAFHKLTLGKLTPGHSLALLENARESIQELKSLLSGG